MRANGKNMNHADNADEKKKKNTDEKDDAEKLKQKSAYDIAKLYRFADRIDIQIMAVGAIFALVQAVLPPFSWLFMGDFMTYAIQREEVKANRTKELANSTSRKTFTNSTASNETFRRKQAEFDHRFELSAGPATILMLSFSIATFLAAFIQRLAWEFSSIRQVFRAKKAYIQKLLHMDVAWLESRHSGQVASMLHEQADSIYHGIADHVPMTVFILWYLLVTVSVCLYIRWDVMLVILMAFPVLFGTRLIFSKWFCKTIEDETNLLAKIANLVSETFDSIRTVISFGAQKQTLIKFERLSIQHRRLTQIRLRASSIYDSLVQILFTELILTAALFYGIWLAGNDNPGRLGALAINIMYICMTSVTIGFHISGAITAKQNAKEMESILNEAPSIEAECPARCIGELKITKNSIRPVDSGDATMCGKKVKPKGMGTIAFKNVRFSYPSRPEIEVLRGLSFDIKQGEHLAVVGPSGSGKSTLTALILRFYDPSSGSIEMDGEDLRNMYPDDVRALIGIVSQEPVLFDGTIGDNIRHGRLDAKQTDINEAARRTESWGFINVLPDGMKTRVGSRGIQLSGGQKQRIAICRAVIRNPSLIIFDEATSALDTKHEGEVQKAIEAARQGVTSITIAHRLSTIRYADRIIVLEAGEIVEEGAPDQLLSDENGRFYKMYMDQRLETMSISTPSTSTPPSTPTKKIAPVQLNRFASLAPADFNNLQQQESAETRRKAWLRSSLGASRRSFGRSYSVRSIDRQKMALPVLSRPRSMMERKYSFRKNVMEIPVDNESIDSDLTEMAGEKGNKKAILSLVREYKKGHLQLAFAFPVAIFRGIFFLLICFEVASVLEIVMEPSDETAERIFFVAAIYIALIILKTIMEAVGRLLVAFYGHGLCEFLRYEMFKKMLRHGVSYFDEERNSPGRLTYKIMSETSTLNRVLGSKLDLLVPAAVCALVSILIALVINWRLTLLCGFQFPAFLLLRLVQFREAGKRQRQMAEEEKKAANLASVVLANMSTIKAYSLQRHFFGEFCKVLAPLQRAMKYQSVVSSFVFACQFSFTYILIAVTLYFGKVMILNDSIDPFDFLRVVLLTQFGANYLSQMVASITDISKAKIAAESIRRVIGEGPVDMDNLSEEGFQPKVFGNITLKGVELRYPARPAARVLRNVNLNIVAGKSLAIVGPSGSGKSSIIALVQRLYNPTRGKVILEGHDVRTINPNYLHRVVVSVSQEPTLFSFTIKENIAYGLPDSEVSMDSIVEAAKIANIHDFIVSLPQGYETEVGEFGAQLSGGQKQRIAIARALIRKPAVLLLDEATAALDTASEKAVQSALEEASKSSTCIYVSHRLSSIRFADEIIVLVDGKIMEHGTHDELMEKQGLYFEMNQLEL